MRGGGRGWGEGGVRGFWKEEEEEGGGCESVQPLRVSFHPAAA